MPFLENNVPFLELWFQSVDYSISTVCDGMWMSRELNIAYAHDGWRWLISGFVTVLCPHMFCTVLHLGWSWNQPATCTHWVSKPNWCGVTMSHIVPRCSKFIQIGAHSTVLMWLPQGGDWSRAARTPSNFREPGDPREASTTCGHPPGGDPAAATPDSGNAQVRARLKIPDPEQSWRRLVSACLGETNGGERWKCLNWQWIQQVDRSVYLYMVGASWFAVCTCKHIWWGYRHSFSLNYIKCMRISSTECLELFVEGTSTMIEIWSLNLSHWSITMFDSAQVSAEMHKQGNKETTPWGRRAFSNLKHLEKLHFAKKTIFGTA